MSQIEKKLIFDQKNKIFQRLKNRIFAKGLTHAFSQKMEFFSLVVFSKKGLEIRLNDVLDRKKNLFMTRKTKFFNVSKIAFFQRGFKPAFSQKMHFFLQLFLVNKGLEIRLNDVLDRKRTFFGLEKQNFSTSQKAHFSKMVNPCLWSKNGIFSLVVFYQKRTRNKVQ